MTKRIRFGSVVSIAVLASLSVGCAAPQGRALTAGSMKADGDVGLAVRAAAALSANDFNTAVSLAERAAEKTPNDAAIRALLGNAYFAAGRFASAESAYKDSLFVQSNQPKVILKLVLVEIAQGKNDEALRFLSAGKDVVDPADYGLALALAGRPEAGIEALEPVARSADADARVRQNLALTFALAGDWANARAVAAQDVPADQLDGRIHQWMQLANSQHASDQVAALVGVTPAAADPGQPVRLALRDTGTRLAAAAPAPATAGASAPTVTVPLPPVQQPQVAIADPPPAPAQPEAPAPAPAPQQQAPVQAPMTMAAAAAMAPDAPAAFAAMMARASYHPSAPKPAAPRRLAAAIRPSAPKAPAPRSGGSPAVLQLGAYGSPQRVAIAWNAAAHRFGNLRAYRPMSARFTSARGPVYRLAVIGFSSFSEANALCGSLRRSGTACFVRNPAGDAPVQIAMR